jgi:hypothetical protein
VAQSRASLQKSLYQESATKTFDGAKANSKKNKKFQACLTEDQKSMYTARLR